jgi:hypothetical protein
MLRYDHVDPGESNPSGKSLCLQISGWPKQNPIIIVWQEVFDVVYDVNDTADEPVFMSSIRLFRADG